MRNLIFESITLFHPEEGKAKHVSFTNGINVLTSDKINGNNVGKTTVIKSLFHAMGADCKFEGRWPDKEIIYLLIFEFGDDIYTIYRHDRLFRVLSKSRLILQTTKRRELSAFYEDLFGFAIYLPSRSEEKLEIAPPAFLFLLNYLDHPTGPNFTSFESLQEYSDFKDTVIYSHLGAFDKRYYNLMKDLERQKENKKEWEEKCILLESMLRRIETEILDIDYSSSLESLQRETRLINDAYSQLANQLNTLKNKIIDNSNKKIELMLQIQNMQKAILDLGKSVSVVNATHKCPTCSSDVTDLSIFRAQRYNQLESIVIPCDELSQLLGEVEKSLQKQEAEYYEKLVSLNAYKESVNLNRENAVDVIKQEGAIAIRDQFVVEATTAHAQILQSNDRIKLINKDLKTYADKKKEINEEYYTYMVSDKDYFKINEIDEERLKTIKSTFKATESNTRLATIIWYMNLLKLKKRFNDDIAQFPMVIDSPTAGELDDTKNIALWKHIFCASSQQPQLIISTLGFRAQMIDGVDVDNLVVFSNPKYEMLNSEDYKQHAHFLEEVLVASSEVIEDVENND